MAQAAQNCADLNIRAARSQKIVAGLQTILTRPETLNPRVFKRHGCHSKGMSEAGTRRKSVNFSLVRQNSDILLSISCLCMRKNAKILRFSSFDCGDVLR